MPLIIITGLPTSGKSTRAKQLYDYLAERLADTSQQQQQQAQLQVQQQKQQQQKQKERQFQPPPRLHLISDHSLSISRSVYDLSPASLPAHTRSANASEKDARAAIYSAVKRVLSDRDFVILDGLNYIKGWRYQLHCEAKAVRTPSCVLQVGCHVDTARQVNNERLQRVPQQGLDITADGGYEPANWENLVFRYEEPNPMSRWDSPLFTVVWEDNAAQTRKMFEALWQALAGDARPIVRPNQATAPRGRDACGDYLYVLDRETQAVVSRILKHQTDSADITVPLTASGKPNLVVELPAGRQLGMAQLQRLRRAFLGLNRGGIGLEAVGNMSVDRMREMFVRYLNDTLEKET